MADAPDLGSGVSRRAGSSPVIRSVHKIRVFETFLMFREPCFFVFDINGDINASDCGWNICCDTGGSAFFSMTFYGKIGLENGKA